MLSEKSFDTGELVINYGEGSAEAAPMVLLHGSTRWWREWEPIFPALEPDWHLYALDLRGHGQSGRDGDHYRLADYSRDVEAFVRDAVDGPVVLTGYSLGAMAAIMVAAQMPERVRALALLDPPLYGQESARIPVAESGSWFAYLKQILAVAPSYEAIVDHMRATQPEMLAAQRDVFARILSQLAPGVLDVAMRSGMVDYDAYHAALAHIACPTLIIRADPACGGLIPDADVEFARARIRDLCVAMVSKAAHHELLEVYAEDTLRALLAFLHAL